MYRLELKKHRFKLRTPYNHIIVTDYDDISSNQGVSTIPQLPFAISELS